MADFKQQYKNPRPGFGHADHGRVLRASKHVESRREVRTRAFDKNRKLQDVSISASPLEDMSIKDARMKKLIKWREERKRKKKMEAARKKPAFKVGVVHHSVYSPVTRSAATTVTNATTVGAKTSKQTTQSNNNFPKGITKATQKRLLSKATSKQQIVTKNIAAASTSTKYPSMNIKKPTSSNKKQKSFAPDKCEFKPPNGLLKMPLFGLVQVEQTPQEKGDFFIQDKSTECKTIDRNEQKDTSSQKLNEKIPDINGTTTNFKISASPKLSNEQKSLQRLNKSICDDLNDVTPQLNKTTTKLSSEEEIQDSIQDSSQNKSLSGNTDIQTPSQKNTPINTSFGNRNCTEDLITFSPYLTLSRGKKNARKEQQQRLGIYPRLSDEIPTKDTVMKNLNISVEEEERTAQYFKFLLNKETERLKELCRKWLDIKLEKDIPDDAMYEIHQAVGQTNLLINKKFERFRSLVEDCENGKGEKLVTCRDLQGFWDMAYMEVRNCDSRFEKLEQRRNSGWQEECIVAKPAVKKRMPIKKQIEPSKPQAKSSSSLRSLIMAARKEKMQGKTSNLMQDTNIKDVSIKHFTPSKNTRKSVNFDDSTDTQCNTRKSKSFELTRKSTPIRRESFKSLVQEVQLSGNKRIKSPFVTMKVSQMGKTPEIQLDDTISYINSDQTPGKSILKKSEELVHKETHTKSAHKVNFDDQIVLNEVPLDEEEQTKLNLSLALRRIDNLDLDELSPEECFHAEKKLNFETDDSDHFDDMNEISTEIQRLDKEKPNKYKLSIQDTFDSNAHSLNTTFDKESSPSDARIISPKKKLKYQNQHKNMENINISATPLETEISSENVFINIIPATPLETATPSDTILNKTEMENHDLGIKILRNRTITTVNTPKIDRTSKSHCTPRRSVSKKENKDPVKSNRKSLLKLSQKDENKYKTPDKDNITEMRKTILTENIDKKRRSSRKSVAFSAETCLACAESKPVLPMTPHSKRNRNKTPPRQSRSKHACNENLILWDTPKHIPNRVTRSHTKN